MSKKLGLFKLGDLFQIENCKCSKASILNEGPTPYVGATNRNNGVLKFVERDTNLITKGNCIAFICDGEGSIGYSVYKEHDFIGSTTIKVGRHQRLNRNNALYITTVADTIRGKYNFGYKRNEKNLKAEILQLPVDEAGNPDWKFMEDYIKQERQKQVNKVVEYCRSELKKENQQSFNKVEWASFPIEEIAEVKSGRDIYKRERTKGMTPYITATAVNNGIGYFVSNSNNTIESKCISVNRNGSVGYAFYHPYEALYGNDTRKIIPHNREGMYPFFLAESITQQKEKYGYGYKMGTARIKRQKIMLPISKENNIDFEFIQKYMEFERTMLLRKIINYFDK